ncbi:MAG: hypothetical protein EON91_14230 [Brevundimonas sp.]|uniref:hypothetical protein n=1 Tax=Brevundimonas sp. TaxID=1871086 RepID=UPI0012198C5D|nr:hypothetical protein [Brevundimonas sp.]RZJ16136.1 MAG: hypothetical protein EON91_14230 [Brevundimonas sp.]
MARSRVELMGLEFEAERLVRAGESRAEVSRVLGVSVQTLAGWALRGGWRRKDIELEKSGTITRRVIRNVAAGHVWAEARRALEAEQAEVMREVGVAMAAGDGVGLARLMVAAPEGMRARPVLEGEAVVVAGPGLSARHGEVPLEGVMSEEAFFAAHDGEEEDDGWEDGAVAD